MGGAAEPNEILGLSQRSSQSLLDAAVQHSRRRYVRESIGQSGFKAFELGSPQSQYHAGLGAKLTDPKGDGPREAPDNFGLTLPQGAGHYDQWVKRAHFGEDRDRVGPARSKVKQGSTRL